MLNQKEYSRQYYIENREKIIKYGKNYYSNHKKKIKEYYKEYYLNNREKIKTRSSCQKYFYLPEYCREYHQKHKERIKEYYKKYYIKNRKKCLEQSKQWRKNNTERAKENRKKWNNNNPERHKAINQRRHTKRRAKEKDIINTLTSQEWFDILEVYNYRCAYCGIEFDCENLPTKDHVIPISKGGHNTKNNIVPACRNCNSKKWAKLIKPFQPALQI